jgi:hypothetical protein
VGFRITITPIKPTIIAIIRLWPIFSPKKKIDKIEIKKTDE